MPPFGLCMVLLSISSVLSFILSGSGPNEVRIEVGDFARRGNYHHSISIRALLVNFHLLNYR